MTHNDQCAEKMSLPEVSRVVTNVWTMTLEGRNWIGLHSSAPVMRQDDVDELATVEGKEDVAWLLAFLRRHNGQASTLMIPNALAKDLSWWTPRLTRARARLVELGYVHEIRPPTSVFGPALYRWGAVGMNGRQEGAKGREG
jgi:hypothetical protein